MPHVCLNFSLLTRKTLKARLAEILPKKAEEVKQLKKEYGKTVCISNLYSLFVLRSFFYRLYSFVGFFIRAEHQLLIFFPESPSKGSLMRLNSVELFDMRRIFKLYTNFR